jgi:hypothetical protein
MRVFRVAAVGFPAASLLAGLLLGGLSAPARAQDGPHVNLLSDQPSKTQDEIEAEQARERAYKESLKKIPDAKASSDPWGGVRNTDTPKTPAAKTTASAKPKAKTGNNAN